TTFANFYVRYLQSEKMAKANATFRSGMTQENSEPLDLPKGVFFHNGNMNPRKIDGVGTRYSYNFKGDFSDNFQFRFEDPLKGKVSHDIQMNPITNYSFEGDISKSNGITVKWEGAPLNENESMVFLISNENAKHPPFEIKGGTTTSEIKIPAEKLTRINTGPSTMYMVRKQTQITQKPNFVALSEMEFYTSEKDIDIVE
ncbi:MAG: hypothetical protein AAF573_22935, partial [Bacteroidota bacterium]